VATITLSDAALEKLAAIQQAFDDILPGLDAANEYLIDRWHNLYLGDSLPDGWELNNDLTLADLEVYFDAYNGEEYLRQIASKRDALGLEKNADVSLGVWTERTRVIRAAVLAGWIVKPSLTLDEVGKLSPAKATQVKNALDRHYQRLLTADPNL
jgi:hypothetical protein